MSHHLVGVAEVAQILGISRQRVNVIVRTDPLFPRPVVKLAAGRIWNRAEVEAWATDSGRTLRSEATAEKGRPKKRSKPT
jgi:predicted DNA-binding transcriptional regulator AlpA